MQQSQAGTTQAELPSKVQCNGNKGDGCYTTERGIEQRTEMMVHLKLPKIDPAIHLKLTEIIYIQFCPFF